MKRIAVLTSGGDAPGMNAAIRAVVRTAVAGSADVWGIRCGYAGLMAGSFMPLGPRDVGGILELGGTMLESARCPEFKSLEAQHRAVAALREHSIDGLIVIGGNGSQTGALALREAGVAVNGVASTIDNDLCGSDITIGVDTALNVALESIDRLRTTAASHRRVAIVEVMGRECGYLALAAGLAGGAEVVVTPEHDHPPQAVREQLHNARQRGKRHAVVVVAEGARHGAQALYEEMKKDLDHCLEPRLTVLGHVQRGGRPSAFDRLLATRLAARATEMLLRGEAGFLVGFRKGSAHPTPLPEVIGKKKRLPSELLWLAETMRM